jgi:ribosomal protein L7/L12
VHGYYRIDQYVKMSDLYAAAESSEGKLRRIQNLRSSYRLSLAEAKTIVEAFIVMETTIGVWQPEQ